MRITVLSGSPKGSNSVTMQYVKYLQKLHPDHEFTTFDVAGGIGKLERDSTRLDNVVRTAADSNLVIWAFPLYYLLCCSQYKRFIELVFRDHENALTDVPAAVLTTSIKFYDSTAHDYLQAVIDDLGMNYCGGYSARTDDLLEEDERKRLDLFFRELLRRVETKSFLSMRFSPLKPVTLEYTPGDPAVSEERKDIECLVLADLSDPSGNLRGMVSRFTGSFSGNVTLVDISEIDFAPCQGCCRCGFGNECIYGIDDYHRLYTERVLAADIIVLAGYIRDRYLSSTWKRFFDRSFFMGHTPHLAGKQMGILVSGRLSQAGPVEDILRSWLDIQRCGLVDIVTDEQEESQILDAAIDSLAEGLAACLSSGYVPPPTFRYEGGIRIFRDEIWGRLRPVFQQDHTFYRKHGLYDFPQKRIGMRILRFLLYYLLRIPPVRKAFKKRMTEGMVQRYRKVLERI